MTSPSDQFKRRLIAPIDALFKDALDGHAPALTSAGQSQIAAISEAPSSATPLHKRSKKATSELQKVDEVALKEALYAVNGLIGLKSAKYSLRRLANFARIEAERRRLRLPQSSIGFHCVFSGSPGTGKTSFARLLARILNALGILQSGHTVEVDKSGLIGEYLGQTPLKVEAAFDRADGGVLFIDEAYSLSRDTEDLYGQEAIDMIVKLMEDRRDRVVVVVAGYQKEMRQFIQSNPGLRSRFNRTIHFDDFEATELLAIQKQMIRACGFDASDGFILRAELLWQQLHSENLTGDANARMVRSALELCLENQATRLVQANAKEAYQLCELLPQDMDGIENQLRKDFSELK